MKTLILRRLMMMPILLLGITFICFLVIQLAPGDFVSAHALNPQISKETLDAMRSNFGLDRHWVVQYFMWLSRVIRLDLGESFNYHAPVLDLIGSRAFNTIVLSACSMIFAWTLALPLGIIAALTHDTPLDRGMGFFAFFGMSIPNFFFALLLLYVVTVTGWLPSGGTVSITYDSMGFFERIFDRVEHLIVPTIVLGTAGTAGLMRLMRAEILRIKHSEYVRTARAKGLSERTVVLKHIVRNALNPFVTIAGYELGALIGGAALVENVLGLQGLGTMMLKAVMSKDIYLLMASILVGSLLLIIGNLMADIALAKVDPRIRYE